MTLRLTEDVRYRILRLIEENPEIRQRELAAKLGISLGKANFCLKALVDKGVIKATRFCNSRNKSAYLYVLTPSGVAEKARVTIQFLRRKMAEYEALRSEIEELTQHARQEGADATELAGVPGADEAQRIGIAAPGISRRDA